MNQPEQERLIQELRRWHADHQPLRELRDRLWKVWLPSAPDALQPADETKRNPYISKVRDPRTTHAVETILPRIVGEEPRMSYKAIDDAEDEPIAAIMSGLVSWQLERMGFENEVRNFVRQGLVANYTVAKVGWLREEREVEIPHETTDYYQELGTHLTTAQPEKQVVVLRNAPFFETVNADDFLWPLTAKSIQTATAVWQRRFVTRSYLEERSDVYRNVDKVTFDDAGRVVDSRRGQYEAQGLNPSPSIDGDKPEDGVAELWERWGLYESNPCHLWAVANPLTGTGVELRDEDSPFDHNHKPFVDWSPIPNPFQLQGIGIVQLVYDLNEHLNTLLRQLSDMRTYQLNPAWKSVGLPANQLSLFPGMNLELDDLQDIAPLQMPVIDSASAWREVQETKQAIQDVSGAFEYLSGGAQSPQQTATGVATITNEGNKRIAEMIKGFGERTMKPLGWMLALLNAQYIDTETAVDFSNDPDALAAWQKFTKAEQGSGADGPGLVRVDAEAIKTKGRLEPLPDVGQDKQVNEIQRRSDAVQLLQAVQPFLMLPQPVVNVPGLAAYILKAFGVSKVDREKILSTPDQPSQVDLMAAEAQLGTGGNGSGPSGPSGDNRPTGAVVGAPGASGPSGPASMAGLA